MTGDSQRTVLQDAVIEHALKDSEHYKIALAVTECAGQLKSIPLERFLSELVGKLKEVAKCEELGPGWEVIDEWKRGGSWLKNPLSPDLPITLRKNRWPAASGITLMLSGNRIMFGFRAPTEKDKDYVTKHYEERNGIPFLSDKIRNDIFEKLNKQSLKGKPYPGWWPIWWNLDELRAESKIPKQLDNTDGLLFFYDRFYGQPDKNKNEILNPIIDLFKEWAVALNNILPLA